MRGVLGEHRSGDRAAALQRRQRFAGDQRLAAQDSMLVGKRQPQDFELLLFDDTSQTRRRFLLLRRPEAVTLDKAQRVTPGGPSLRGAKRRSNPVLPRARLWIASLRSQ